MKIKVTLELDLSLEQVARILKESGWNPKKNNYVAIQDFFLRQLDIEPDSDPEQIERAKIFMQKFHYSAYSETLSPIEKIYCEIERNHWKDEKDILQPPQNNFLLYYPEGKEKHYCCVSFHPGTAMPFRVDREGEKTRSFASIDSLVTYLVGLS